jgi:hypothetical protein
MKEAMQPVLHPAGPDAAIIGRFASVRTSHHSRYVPSFDRRDRPRFAAA